MGEEDERSTERRAEVFNAVLFSAREGGERLWELRRRKRKSAQGLFVDSLTDGRCIIGASRESLPRSVYKLRNLLRLKSAASLKGTSHCVSVYIR